MNKMLVAVFDSEAAAFEGSSALKELHRDGDVSVYATAVLEKGNDGQVSIKQADEKGGAGVPIGLLAGGFIGLLAGPVGMAIGASLGGLTGMIVEINRSGVDVEFLNDVSEALSPGKSALLADIQEGWTVPVDTRLGEHGGIVFRRLRSEVVEDQLEREAEQFNAEMAELEQEFQDANDEAKASIEAHMDKLKERMAAMQGAVENRLDATRHEAEEKLATLENQLQEAGDRKKAKIEKRLAEAKAQFESRSAKLGKAADLVKDALS